MENDQTRIVWLTLLAMADQHGEVQASIPGLANVARVSVSACEEAIRVFLNPDPYSRTKTDEGRRIVEMDGGWHILNHEKYRELASDTDRKRKAAERQRRRRARLKETDCHAVTGVGVTGCDKSHQNPQAEAEAEADTEAKTERDRNTLSPTLEEVRAEVEKKNYTSVDPARWWSYWDSIHWTEKSGRLIKWKSRLMNDNLTPKPAWMLNAEKAAKEAIPQSRYNDL